MVKTSLLLATLAVAASVSARPVEPQQPLNSVLSPMDSQTRATRQSRVKRETSSSTGFCRKRAPQAGTATGTPDNLASEVNAQPTPVASSAAVPASPTSEPAAVVTVEVTQVIDITSTIFVTAGQPEATLSSSAPSSVIATPSSSAPVNSSQNSTNLESQGATGVPSFTPGSSFPVTPTPPSSVPTSSVASSSSSNSPIAPSSSAPAPSAPSSTPGICPPGSSWQTVVDNFATLDESLWTQVSGTREQVTFGKDGLLMKLDQQHAAIVFEGKAKWTAPVTMSASIKSAQAPGVINAAIFGTAGTDEIDLELIEGSWQVPLWHDGKRLEKGQDVSWTLADTSNELASWVFDDPKAIPFERVHEWSVNWQSDSLTWSADGRKLLDVKKLDGGAWPNQALPFRWGPWATDAGWAGKLDWAKNPEPVMQLQRVVIEGCQLD